MKHESLVGRTFGKMEVIRRVENEGRHVVYECVCICGTKKTAWAAHLKRGAVVTCGCSRTRRGRDHPCWQGVGEISGDIWTQIYRNQSQSGRRARRGLAYELTIQQAWDLFLAQERRCALTGIELHFGEGGKGKGRTASLDRRDSSRGYTIDNVQWVHKDINWMKNTFPENYFVEMCRQVADHSRAA